MTTKARLVLMDLKTTHSMLEIETDYSKFRIIFVSAITLARAIGHVLDKVDSLKSVIHKKVIKQHFDYLKTNKTDNLIFHEFINSERNSILKEYDFGFLSQPTPILIDSVDTNSESFLLDDCLFCPLINGHFAGEDCRDILKMAIEWWEIYLNEIDNLIQFEQKATQ